MSVVITEWENKEYQELCAGRDRTIASMQAQLKIQNAEAIKEAAKFDETFELNHLRKMGNSSIVAVYDAANEIIAQE